MAPKKKDAGVVYISTEEIDSYDEEFIQILEEIQKGTETIHKAKGPAKQQKLQALLEKVQRAKQILHSFKVEIRELAKEQQIIYENKHRQHSSDLEKYFTELNYIKNELAKKELLAGGQAPLDPETMSAQELIQHASGVQDQSLTSIARSKQMIAASKEVGVETGARLKEQTEQLKNIDADIIRVESNLRRADKLIKAFMRRMATDKVILCFLFLIICGVIGIVVFKVMYPEDAKDAGINVPDKFVPPLQDI